MKKNKFIFITRILLVIVIVVCSFSWFFQMSFSASSEMQEKISKDVDTYYRSLSDTRKMKVSVTIEELNSKVDMILQYETDIAELQQLDNISTVYNQLKSRIPDGSGKVNVITGYIKMKWNMDEVLKETTKAESNLTVAYDDNVEKYFKYDLCEAPASGDYNTSFLSKARAVKERVESLILVYQVTKDKKYLAALKKEIVEAAKWGNNWQSVQYIDTAEIAYAVSLGYDFAYGALTETQRCVIENRLLLSLLLYTTKNCSEGIKKLNGNFNQVGHSGVGIMALTLINSSNLGEIRVLSSSSSSIEIEYPVKKYENKTIKVEYSRILIDNKSNAAITNPELIAMLKSKIKDGNGKKYITLRTLYSSIIATTTDYLPRVMKADNMYIDGSYPEGKQYHLYGMRYYSYYVATLRNTLGDTYNLLNFESDPLKNKALLNNIVLNPVYISNAKGQNLNYADARKNATDYEDDLFYLANYDATNGYPRCAHAVYDYRKRTSHMWKFYSIIWYNESNDPKNNPVEYDDVFNASIYNNTVVKENLNRLGVSSFRDSYTNNNGLFVAMKAGTTTANHTHLDLGTYVYDNMGTNWIVDTGSGDYDGKKYHDKEYLRWQYFATRAEAHSTIVVNKPTVVDRGEKGNCLAADQWVNATAKFTKLETSDKAGLSVVNLTNAYNKTDNDKTKNVQTIKNNKVLRGLKLFNNKKYVLIQDEVHLEDVTSYFSMINVNNEKVKDTDNLKVVIESISEDKKEAVLKDTSGHKVKLILKSNNSSIKFVTIDSLTNETGYLNSFIKYKDNNTNIYLDLNDEKVNRNKLVVYLHNTSPTTIDLKYGVFIIPINDEPINEDILKLNNLSSWYVPSPPTVKVYKGNNEVNNNDTIYGDATIKINSSSTNKPNEVIRYSLDSGTTWYVYDDNNSTDVQRRTISGIGKHNVSVLAIADDGAGVQSNTTNLSNFSLNIEDSSTEPPYTIHKYTVDENNKYIDMVDPKTTLNTYKGYITLGNNYSLSINLGTKEYIYTGSVTKINNGNTLAVQYTNIVRGDIDGDGKVTSLDYVKVKKHIMNTDKIKDNVYKKAADANKDDNISSLDYIRIKNVVMNGG